MARYTGPVCRLCRREGEKLYLKAERCFGKSCPVDKHVTAPGEHGQFRRKLSEYGIQLREKQKVRRIYGVMEAQFRRYFSRAARRPGVTGEALLQLLETRLDNVVFRLGFAGSRRQARQLATHGHFLVNGRRVDVPSLGLKVGDVVALRPASRGLAPFKEAAERGKKQGVPGWLEVDWPNFQGRVLRLPSREEIDVPVQEHLVVELYSR
ncbi:MAG: 30S ribosomal protein S4 [Acetobacteraceae bacterium]|nr:30S ribosomal protein S4 [Acetobacteraceae bacterium]